MRYLIVGNGVAGTTAAAKIRKLDSAGEITIITDESIPFYSRIRLIDYLSGEADEKDIVVYDNQWYESNNIRLIMDTFVSDIDKDRKQIIASPSGGSSEERFEYDRLLLATGSFSFIPPIPGADKEGVFTLRTLKNAREIIDHGKVTNKVILIGGGVLGLEAGNALRKRGLEITVVEFFSRLLPRQMDTEGAEVLKAQLESMGFNFYLGAKTKEIFGDKKVKGIVLEGGTTIEGDLIIISAGVRPHVELGKKLNIAVGKGLPVNDRMETEIKDIFAAGDLIEHRGIFYGIWPASQKQGDIAGTNMAGGHMLYDGTTMSNVLKIAGIDLAAAGDIDAEGKSESIIQKDRGQYIYKKLVIKDSILSGCILYGDIRGYRKILRAVEEKKDIVNIRTNLEKWDLSVL